MLSLTVMRQSWTPGSIMPMQYCLVGHIWTSSDCFFRLFYSDSRKASFFCLPNSIEQRWGSYPPSDWCVRVDCCAIGSAAWWLSIFIMEYVWHQNYTSSRADIFVCYFSEFACGGDEYVYAIPWEKLVKNPNQFFDTSLYKLPNALNAPNVMKPSHIFGLHEFFSSTPRPFQFRTQSRSALLRAQRMN